VNVVVGFLCLARRLHACDPACHGPCLKELREELGGRRIFSPVDIPVLSRELGSFLTEKAEDAEILVITGGAMIEEKEGGDLRDQAEKGEMLLLGPSTEGVASLLSLSHWCPYGR
jgi:hypothetical protein